MRTLCALLTLICAASVAYADPPRVHIESGDLIGAVDGAVESFKGVPYAAPPVGALRWRAPIAAAHWAQPRDASNFGFACPQPPRESNVFASAPLRTNEDCLYLNVWAPVVHAHPLPVMVWLHGGGNTRGSGSGVFYDGTAFARDGVVLVTLNYRLGLLGFFAHPALTREAGKESTGNYALLDQIAALQWVARNIAAFGGDAHNITVFGESAGGEDILALLTSPLAKGLFQKAIVESGPLPDCAPLQQAESDGAKLASKLGLPGATATASQLRSLSVEALTNAVPEVTPIVDGRLLRESPQKLIARGDALDVPLMIGVNGNEGSLLGEHPRASEIIPTLAPEEIRNIQTLYGAQANDDDSLARLLFRDAYFAAPARWVAAERSRSGPVYLYRFDYVMSLLRFRRSGANHGSEIPYVFSSWTTKRLSPEDQKVTDLVHGCWIAFATDGKPDCTGMPAWPAYSPQRDTLMEIGGEAPVLRASDKEVLDILQRQSAPSSSRSTSFEG